MFQIFESDTSQKDWKKYKAADLAKQISSPLRNPQQAEQNYGKSKNVITTHV